MSRRTVFQLVLACLSALAITAPCVAQAVLRTTLERPQNPPVPENSTQALEVLPMPREKSSWIEHYGIGPLQRVTENPSTTSPPHCAFDSLPKMPQNLADIIGEFVNIVDGNCYHNAFGDRPHLLIFKAPPLATSRPGYPSPVVGLTTIRWDESGGGWWVETIRVPQPRRSTDENSTVPVQQALPIAAQTPATTQVRAKEEHSCCNASGAPCCAAANKLAGTWFREMEGYLVSAVVNGDELKLSLSQAADGTTVLITVTAEFAITKEGLVHGVVSGTDVAVSEEPKHAPKGINCAMTDTQLMISLQNFVDCPFSFRARMTSAGLMISNMKVAFPGEELKEALQLLCGMYKQSKDGSLPPLKPRKTTVSSCDNGKCERAASATAGAGIRIEVPALGPIPLIIDFETQVAPPLPPPGDPQPCVKPNAKCPLMNPLSERDAKPARNLFSFSKGVFDDYPSCAGACTLPSPPVPVTPQAMPVPVAAPVPPRVMPAPVPAPMPPRASAPGYSDVADAFGQMLVAAQAPVPGRVVPPPPTPPCPVQGPLGFYPATGVAPVPCPVQGPLGYYQVTGVAQVPTTTAPRTLAGTWVRVVGPVVYSIKITPEHMTFTATSATEISEEKVVTECVIMTADYQLMRDGTTAVGLITSFDSRIDGELPTEIDFDAFIEELSKLQKALGDKPFALSARLVGDALVIGNVRLPEVEAVETWSPMTVLGGRYSMAGDKPLPKPKPIKAHSMPPGCPLPAPVYSQAYPAGVINSPVMPPIVPQTVIAPPGITHQINGTLIHMVPTYVHPGSMYPDCCYPSPYVGTLSGCGVMTCPVPSAVPMYPPAMPSIDEFPRPTPLPTGPMPGASLLPAGTLTPVTSPYEVPSTRPMTYPRPLPEIPPSVEPR